MKTLIRQHRDPIGVGVQDGLGTVLLISTIATGGQNGSDVARTAPDFQVQACDICQN